MYYLVIPSSNSSDCFAEGPFVTPEDALKNRFVNGQILCKYKGLQVVAPAKPYAPAIIKKCYEVVTDIDWIWDWEDKNTSPLVIRYIENKSIIY